VLPDFFLETFTSFLLVMLKRCSRKLAKETSKTKLSNRMPTIIKIFLLSLQSKSDLNYILRFTPYGTENSVCLGQKYQSKNTV